MPLNATSARFFSPWSRACTEQHTRSHWPAPLPTRPTESLIHMVIKSLGYLFIDVCLQSDWACQTTYKLPAWARPDHISPLCGCVFALGSFMCRLQAFAPGLDVELIFPIHWASYVFAGCCSNGFQPFQSLQRPFSVLPGAWVMWSGL